MKNINKIMQKLNIDIQHGKISTIMNTYNELEIALNAYETNESIKADVYDNICDVINPSIYRDTAELAITRKKPWHLSNSVTDSVEMMYQHWLDTKKI